MKKTIALLLVILLMFNFIFANGTYARQADGEEESDSPYTQSAEYTPEQYTEGIESGTAQGTAFSFGSLGASIIGFITGIISRLLNVFIALQIDIIMSDLTCSTETLEDRNRRLSILFYYR